MASKPSTYPELPAIEDFRRIWTSVRSESQLRLAHEPVPTDAGPLNSAALVHRAITLMRELSPEYLRHFLSYVDDLSWLEQVHAAKAPAARDTPRAAVVAKKRARKPKAATARKG
ncbi:DUF2894 domain-containing protein [Luteibacter sp. CQ10]|uniref:DUF2894 domain-containing protein n=1 Tax=Luteibacter sp. CQ10 TaxID=2805821 RepID=UPI0034A35333